MPLVTKFQTFTLKIESGHKYLTLSVTFVMVIRCQTLKGSCDIATVPSSLVSLPCWPVSVALSPLDKPLLYVHVIHLSVWDVNVKHLTISNPENRVTFIPVMHSDIM